METNFVLIDNYAVQYGNYFLDLHNNYELIQIVYCLDDNYIEYSFKISTGICVSNKVPKGIQILHFDINYLNIDNSDQTDKREDIKTISNITYWPNNNREENHCIHNKNIPDENDDILYMMLSGLVLRINCKKIELRIREET